MSNPNKPVGYTLFIDEANQEALDILLALSEEGIMKLGIDELIKIRSLVHTMSERSHELGWCKDPNCHWKPKNKGLSQGESA